MAKQIVNIGTSANDGTGDPWRTAFQKINSNADEIYTQLDLKEPLTVAGTTSQYRRGDKTWATLDKNSVGLGNVSNTSDALKPLSDATNAALQNKVNRGPVVDSGLTTDALTLLGRGNSGSGNVEKLSTFQAKQILSLDQVNNTSDIQKPLSDATKAALDIKAPLIHTHTPNSITMNGLRLIGRTDSGQGEAAELTDVQAKIILGLSNVDNTRDIQKPISDATRAAIEGRAPLNHVHNIDQVLGLQSALDNKATLVHSHSISSILGLQPTLDSKANLNQLIRSIKFFLRGNLSASNPAVDVVAGAFTINTAMSAARSMTPPSAQTVMDIRKNGTTIGTITWETGSNTGTISIPQAGNLNVEVADFLEIYPPASGGNDITGVAIVLRN